MTGGSAARAVSLLVLLLAAAAFRAPIAAAEPVGAVEQIPTKCDVQQLVSGPDGNVWFSCRRYTGGVQGRLVIGRVTPAGAVTEFTAGIPAGAEINDLVAGPDGNVWFTLDAGFGSSARIRGRSAIGRITPEGVVTLFSAGLRKKSYPAEIIVGPDGNLWFFDGLIVSTGLRPEIGRVTLQGSITEFPTGLPEALTVGGLAAGPDGNLWFSHVFDLPSGPDEPGGLIGRMTPTGTVTSFGAPPGGFGAPIAGPDGNVWFVEDVGRVAIDRVTPSGEITRFGKGQVGIPSHLVVGPDGNIWFTAQQSVGRVTPSGQVSKFTDCMDFRQDFSEATSIISGPGGDLWFSTVTSRMTPSIEEPPTIGRVTPTGEITLFKAGVETEPGSIIAGPDGRVWFRGGIERIDRITPPTAPVNTFILVPGTVKPSGAAELKVEVPGPGKIELLPLSVALPRGRTKWLPPSRTVRAAAPACGPTSLKLRLRGAAVARLRRHRRLAIRVRVTFTPTGGSPDTEVTTVLLRKR